MTPADIASYVASAAASGIIGNRIDSLVTTLEPVQRLHTWLRARLISPSIVQPSSATTSWAASLSEGDRQQLGELLREAIRSAGSRSVHSSGGVAVGNDNYGTAIGNNNYGTVVGSQNYYGSIADGEWEYVKINYGQEGDFDRPGYMKWAAYIAWPGAAKLDVRDHARIENLLNEFGQEGWELVSQQAAVGINTTDYFLRRRKRSRLS